RHAQPALRHRAVGGRRNTGAGRRCASVDTNGTSSVRAYRHRPVAAGGTTQGARDMSQIDYPFQFDGRGRTAQTDESGTICDLIEQVLLTAPGERVMRPSFGSGVLQLVFAAASPEVAATTQFLIQGALQQWLSDVIT